MIVIAKNEEHNIADCLSGVDFCDEKLVLDSGSTDATVAKAQSLGAVCHVAADWQGFGRQKNRALDLAKNDWVLSLDADERVSAELALEIQQALSTYSQQSVAFEIPRLTQFCGQWIRHCGWTPDYVLRVFRRSEARFSDDLVHEKLQIVSQKTTIIRLKSPLLHLSYPTSQAYWVKLQRYSQDWAQQKYAEGRRTNMLRAALSGMFAFVRSYILRLGFLDGSMGFAVCTMQAQAAFGKYFELYCLSRQNAKQ